MTLKTQIAADQTAVFFNTDDFAVSGELNGADPVVFNLGDLEEEISPQYEGVD